MTTTEDLAAFELRHEAAFRAWEEACHLCECIPMGHRRFIGKVFVVGARVPPLGYALHRVQRARYRPHVIQRQRELNALALEQVALIRQAMDKPEPPDTHVIEIAEVHQTAMHLEHELAEVRHTATRLEHELAETNSAIAHVSNVAEHVLGSVAHVSESLTHVQAQTTHIMATEKVLHGRLDSELQPLRTDVLSRLEASVSHIQGLSAEIAELRDHTSTLETTTKLHTAYIDLLQEWPGQDIARGNHSNNVGALRHDDLKVLFEILERDDPLLARSAPVGLSVADASAEDLIIVGASYFGERLDPYGWKTTNQIWYHVDFSDEWNRNSMFDNAASKLSADGNLVIITSPQHDAAYDHQGLILRQNKLVSLRPDLETRVCIWQRSSDNDVSDAYPATNESTNHIAVGS